MDDDVIFTCVAKPFRGRRGKGSAPAANAESSDDDAAASPPPRTPSSRGSRRSAALDLTPDIEIVTPPPGSASKQGNTPGRRNAKRGAGNGASTALGASSAPAKTTVVYDVEAAIEVELQQRRPRQKKGAATAAAAADEAFLAKFRAAQRSTAAPGAAEVTPSPAATPRSKRARTGKSPAPSPVPPPPPLAAPPAPAPASLAGALSVKLFLRVDGDEYRRRKYGTKRANPLQRLVEQCCKDHQLLPEEVASVSIDGQEIDASKPLSELMSSSGLTEGCQLEITTKAGKAAAAAAAAAEATASAANHGGASSTTGGGAADGGPGGPKCIVAGVGAGTRSRLVLRMNGDDNNKLIVSIGLDDPFSALIEATCASLGIAAASRDRVTFVLDGEPLNRSRTMRQEDLEEDMLIDVSCAAEVLAADSAAKAAAAAAAAAGGAAAGDGGAAAVTTARARALVAASVAASAAAVAAAHAAATAHAATNAKAAARSGGAGPKGGEKPSTMMLSVVMGGNAKKVRWRRDMPFRKLLERLGTKLAVDAEALQLPDGTAVDLDATPQSLGMKEGAEIRAAR